MRQSNRKRYALPQPTTPEPCNFCRIPRTIVNNRAVVDPAGDTVARRQVVRCGDDTCPNWVGELAAEKEIDHLLDILEPAKQ